MKYSSLESLRGVAAIMVALFHSGFVTGDKYPVIAQGPIFVDFFFVLSGFVMAFAYQDKITEGLSFRSFVFLRVGRVYPLHLFMLLVWVPYIGAKYYAYHKMGLGPSDPANDNNLITFSSNLLLLHSLGFHDDQNWNTVSWSISVEFYTYLIFFIVISLFRKAYRPVYSLLIVLLSYGALFMLTENSLLRTFDYGILRCVGGFFLGMLVFDLHQQNRFKAGAFLWSIIEITLVLLTALVVSQTDGSKTAQLISFVAFATTVFVFAAQSEGVVSRFLNTSLLRFLGKLSYSIYMVHMIVFTVAAVLAHYILKMPSIVVEREGADLVRYINTPWADLITFGLLVIVVGFSWITYTWVEAPWRDRFRRWSGTVKSDTESVENAAAATEKR